MKAVVTGAAGFIGSHLTESLLADGRDVIGVDAFVDYYPRAAKERNLAAARDHRAFTLVEGSLQDMDLARVLDGATQVFHLAAQAGVRASWGQDFSVYTDNNVLATQRLLEAAVAARVPRLVYASSAFSSWIRYAPQALAAERYSLAARAHHSGASSLSPSARACCTSERAWFV